MFCYVPVWGSLGGGKHGYPVVLWSEDGTVVDNFVRGASLDKSFKDV